MIRKVLTFAIIFVFYSVSDSCVRYTFEKNVDEWFKNGAGLPWNVGKYSTSNLTSPNEQSNSFITPQSDWGYVSSFIFTMNFGGTIEVNIYMDGSNITDQIFVLASQMDKNGNRSTGAVMNSVIDSHFVSEWQTLRITLSGSTTYDGYISILGMKSPDSIVLVDSFRYIPPGMDEAECRLYEDNAKKNHSMV